MIFNELRAQAAPASGPDLFHIHGQNQYGEPATAPILEVMLSGGGAYAHRDGISVSGQRNITAGKAPNVEATEHLARAAVGLSHAGLVARGLGEEVQLQPLVESLKSGRVQADKRKYMESKNYYERLVEITYDAMMRGIELVGTSSPAAPPGSSHTLGCAVFAMGELGS